MLTDIGIRAKKAERFLMTASTSQKNKALEIIAQELIDNCDYILSQNEIDIKNGREKGMSESLIDRLSLTADRIKGISDAVRQIISLDDPCGKVISGGVRPNGLKIEKVSVTNTPVKIRLIHSYLKRSLGKMASKIIASPCKRPHTTKVQLAPCQKPLTRKTIKRLRHFIASPFRLPPKGI